MCIRLKSLSFHLLLTPWFHITTSLSHSHCLSLSPSLSLSLSAILGLISISGLSLEMTIRLYQGFYSGYCSTWAIWGLFLKTALTSNGSIACSPPTNDMAHTLHYSIQFNSIQFNLYSTITIQLSQGALQSLDPLYN